MCGLSDLLMLQGWKVGNEQHLRVCCERLMPSTVFIYLQGILEGEVSLYHWPPVRLVWNQLYVYWQFLFLFAKQTIPNQSNRRSMVPWYFPFRIPLCLYDLFGLAEFYHTLLSEMTLMINDLMVNAGNTKVGSITVPLTSSLTCLD